MTKLKKKAVVFDNSGTLIERYRVVKDIKNDLLIENKGSLELIDELEKGVLVVLQVNPEKCFMNFDENIKIYDFFMKYDIKFDISYESHGQNFNVDKKDILNILKSSEATLKDLQDTVNKVKLNNCNIEICAGTGMIVDLSENKLIYTITSAGRVFPEVKKLMKTLKEKNIDIFIASGDRKDSLYSLANLIEIPESHVFDTANTERKRDIVKLLKKEDYEVMMVGDAQNDVLAFKESDVSVLTLQQRDEIPKKVYEAADHIVNNIKDILKIDFFH